MVFDESEFLFVNAEGLAVLLAGELVWEVDLDAGLAMYQARDTFTVDGIAYRPADAGLGIDSVDTIRTMISLEDEVGGWVTLFYSSPPTEEELDHWVSTGEVPTHPKQRRS